MLKTNSQTVSEHWVVLLEVSEPVVGLEFWFFGLRFAKGWKLNFEIIWVLCSWVLGFGFYLLCDWKSGTRWTCQGC